MKTKTLSPSMKAALLDIVSVHDLLDEGGVSRLFIRSENHYPVSLANSLRRLGLVRCYIFYDNDHRWQLTTKGLKAARSLQAPQETEA